MKTNITLVTLGASLSLYAVSLALPALKFEARPPVRGFTTLLWGWWGILSYDFPWLANIAYFIAAFRILLGRYVGTLKYAIAAVVLGLLSFFVKHWFFSEAEGTPVKQLGSGFYCWMASLVLLLVGYCLRTG